MHRLLLLSLLCPALALSSGPGGPVTVTAVGDTMLASHVTYHLSRFGLDYPWGDLEGCLAGDVVLGNLEAPITDRGEPVGEKTYTFRAPPWTAPALARAGFTVLGLANNHAGDYGHDGLRDTLRHVRDQGIAVVGAGENLAAARRSVIQTIPGDPPIRVAILAYSKTYPFDFFATPDRPGTSPGDIRFLPEDLPRARQMADIVVVSVHWSSEKLHVPKAYQVEWAHRAIDLGADLVVGHHPHVLQPLEVYRGRLIAYSLGNFVFGSYSKAARESMLLRVSFERDGSPLRAEIVPLDVDNRRRNFRPRVLHDEPARELLGWLRDISPGVDLRLQGDRGLIELCPTRSPPPSEPPPPRNPLRTAPGA